jgi:hypothetical protein
MRWFLFIGAAICVVLGLANMVSQRFMELSLRSTSLGNFWKTNVGDRFGGLALRILYGLAHFAVASGLVLVALRRY